MTWQKLKYGTLVAAGLAISGSLWYQRTDATVRAVDMVEIWQGANERFWTVFDPAYFSIVEIVNTNTVYSWTNTSPYTYEVVDPGAGTTSTVQYAERLTNSVVTTNAMDVFWGIFIDDPRPALPPAYIHNGYYAWGGYTQYIASGFSDAAFNQTYDYEKRASGIVKYPTSGKYFSSVVDVYVAANSNALLMYGPHGQPDGYATYAAVLASNAVAWKVPQVHAYVDGTNAYEMLPWLLAGGSASAGTVSGVGVVQTNLLRKGDALSVEFDYSEDYWYFQNAITRLSTARILSGVDTFLSWLGDPFYGIGYYTFVDHTQADTNGIFQTSTRDGFGDIPWLAATNAYMYAGLTNGVFTDTSPQYVRKRDLTERANLLNVHKWTTARMNAVVRTNNVLAVGRSINAASWEDAKSEALSNVVYANAKAYTGPGAWTEGYKKETNSYYARVVLAPFDLVVSDIQTNVSHVADIYFTRVASSAVGLWYDRHFDYEPVVSSNTLDTSILMFPVSGSDYLDTMSSASTTQRVYSLLSTNTVGDVPWCDEPSSDGYTSRGFVGVRADAVFKWDFEYCTNSIP